MSNSIPLNHINCWTVIGTLTCDLSSFIIKCFLFFSIISVKAKSFADREIRYTLKAQGQGAGTFNIGPTSGIVKLAKELDFEDLRQPHVYSLVVTATEDSGGFSTSVEVRINTFYFFIISLFQSVSNFCVHLAQSAFWTFNISEE